MTIWRKNQELEESSEQVNAICSFSLNTAGLATDIGFSLQDPFQEKMRLKHWKKMLLVDILNLREIRTDCLFQNDNEEITAYIAANRALEISQALSTGIYPVEFTQGTGEPAFADDLPHE